jgi:hypothetical protein
MRCDSSLSSRGRGRGNGSLSDELPEGGVPGEGEVTWRKALMLNESSGGRVSTGAEEREGSGRDALDFVRPRGRAQENKPPLLVCLVCGVVCESGLLMVS